MFHSKSGVIIHPNHYPLLGNLMFHSKSGVICKISIVPTILDLTNNSFHGHIPYQQGGLLKLEFERGISL